MTEIGPISDEFISAIYYIIENKYQKMKLEYYNSFLNQDKNNIEKYINSIEKSFFRSFLADLKCKSGAKYAGAKLSLDELNKR